MAIFLCQYTASATSDGKSRLDYTAFAQDWNWSADSKDRFYVTTEVLASYAKKIVNIHASREMIQDKIELQQVDNNFPHFDRKCISNTVQFQSIQ